jgi:hypothetical protein
MPFPFDATLKAIVQEHTTDYEAALGLEGDTPTTVLNADLSTVSAATDVALGHGDPLKTITDLNFQAGPDPEVSDRLLLYNALFRNRFHVPVHTVLVLLRPAADHPNITGKVQYVARKRRPSPRVPKTPPGATFPEGDARGPCFAENAFGNVAPGGVFGTRGEVGGNLHPDGTADAVRIGRPHVSRVTDHA